MKQTFLQQIIIISFFITISVITDIFISSYIRLFKLPLVIIFISGCLLGFPSVFLICCFYSFFHLIRSFSSWQPVMESLKLSFFQILLSVFLDYIFPDLIISISGFCFDKQKKFFSNKRLFSVFLLINCLRLFSSFLSSFFIYSSSNERLANNILVFVFIHNLIPFILNLFLGGLLVYYFKVQLKDFGDIKNKNF
ncbi:hypothetical protein [Candidatus Phytoplasma fraxini]|uniref:Uncharacterized protein n=1 Tax=Ash yellows phytoplasma TaxID=35780 RepID=A0ABZ2U8G6_ASHYP